MVKRLPSEIRDKRRRTAGDAFRRFCLSAAAAAAVLSAGIHGPFAGTERGLLWPVPVHGGCTSSFGEYRLTHFHGGVDIRTDQQEGWPVSAVADGAIVRVRREPGGYGRVLYLRLNDGRTAVYGHLIRFSRKLGVEQALMKACARKQTSFPGNVEFNPPIPVKRGEVVAYSGELGIGYPHLHFEVRRGYDLLDPFLQGLPLPAGITAPRIWGVVFVPRDARGRVDGGVSPLLVRAVKRENGYVLSAPVSISGRVDAELVAEDHLGVASNATGVPLIRASLDGRTFYSMDLSRISLARYKESPDVFDPGWGPGGYMAYRLRKLPELGVHGIEGEGLPSNAVPGVRNLRIIAENRAGQRSVLSGKLRYGRWGDKGAVVRLALPGSGYRLVSRRIVPAGLLLDLRRTDVSGMTPVLADGRPVQGLVVHVLDKNRVKALIPAESLAHRAQYIKVGSMNEPWCV
ncbi:MAG: M23 family metallopeptidase, partial [Acidobacteriota bacterium]